MEPQGAAAPRPESVGIRPQASFTGLSSGHQDGGEPGVVRQPPEEKWKPCVHQTWERKSAPAAVTLTKRTLEKLFAWQYGSSKRYVPSIIFRLAVAGGEVVELLPVTLLPPSRDDSVRQEKKELGQGKPKVDGYPVPADTIQHIYSLLGVQPNGRMQFASEGWRGSCPVMLVSYIPARVEPAAAQQAAERATAAQTTAAPASAQAGMTPPAQSAAWAGGAPNAAAQPAAAGEAAEHASLLTPTSSLERAPSSALRQEEEAQSRPAGEQQCRQQQAQQPQLHVQQPRAQAQMQSPPQPQQERGQQQPQPSPQVAGPAMSAATPQRGTAGSNLADLAAAAEAAAVGQPAAAAGNPLPASNIAAAARTGWLSGEQVLELLSRPQEHGLRIVDFLKAKPGAGDLFLCRKGDYLWKNDGHDWVNRRNADLRVKGQVVVKVVYFKTNDGALQVRIYRLANKAAPNAHLQLLHYYYASQSGDKGEAGPRPTKRKAEGGWSPGSAQRKARPATDPHLTACSAAPSAAARAPSGGAQPQGLQQQPSQQPAEQRAASTHQPVSMQVDLREPEAEQQAAPMQVDLSEPQAVQPGEREGQLQGGWAHMRQADQNVTQPAQQQAALAAQQAAARQPRGQQVESPAQQPEQQLSAQRTAQQRAQRAAQQPAQQPLVQQPLSQERLQPPAQQPSEQRSQLPAQQPAEEPLAQQADAHDLWRRCVQAEHEQRETLAKLEAAEQTRKDAETRCKTLEEQLTAAQEAARLAQQGAASSAQRCQRAEAALGHAQEQLAEKQQALESMRMAHQDWEEARQQAIGRLAAVERELAAEQTSRRLAEQRCQRAEEAQEVEQQRRRRAEAAQEELASKLRAMQSALADERQRAAVAEEQGEKLLQQLTEAQAGAAEAARLRAQLEAAQQQLQERENAGQQARRLRSDAARAAVVEAAGPSPDRRAVAAALRTIFAECQVARPSMQLFLKQEIVEADSDKAVVHWDELACRYRDGDDEGVRNWVELYSAHEHDRLPVSMRAQLKAAAHSSQVTAASHLA